MMGGHGLVPNRSQDGRLRCEFVTFSPILGQLEMEAAPGDVQVEVPAGDRGVEDK